MRPHLPFFLLLALYSSRTAALNGISEFLTSDNCHLRSLCLADSHLRDGSAVVLEALAENRSLHSLNIRSAPPLLRSSFRSSSFTFHFLFPLLFYVLFVFSFSSSSSPFRFFFFPVFFLRLSFRCLFPSSSQPLSSPPSHSQLKLKPSLSLTCSGNGMGNHGARRLAKALLSNCCLREVIWDHNDTSLHGFRDVASSMEQ